MKRVLMFKRVLGVLTATMLVVPFSGCAESDSSSSEVSTTSETTLATQPPSESETDAESTSDITSFEDINTDKVSLIAIGNSDVPVGQYSEEILTSLGFWDDIQSKISFGTNVKEVLSQVAAGSVDCGIVYTTDAATEPEVSVVCEAPESTMQTPVVYPAAVLSETANQAASEAFLNFLLTDAAKAEFEAVGFTMQDDSAAGNTAVTEDCTLTIFAATSLTESLTAIGALFQAENPTVEVVFNFDSSGTLETQITSGAEADIFISAAQKQMTELSTQGLVQDDTKIDLLQNKVVLIVPKT